MTVGELLVKLGADFSQYNKDLAKAEGMARKSGTTIGDMFRNAFSFTLGMGMFQAIQQGFRAVVGGAIDFNSMMEQAQIGFTTMLGSAEKAQAFLEEMGKFAAETPFEYPDLLLATKRMMAMGFATEEVLPTLQAVGDAAAGLGLGKEGIDRITLALGQMRAKSKVSGEEMRQLTEAGVPAWDMLAKAMNKSTAEVMKLSERGLIPADKAVQALVQGMEERFPNMMGKLADSWQGVTSTIKDVWRMTIGAVTQGLFKGIVNWLKGVRDAATSFYNFFSNLRRQGLDTGAALRLAIAQAFGPEVAASLSSLAGVIRTVLGIVVQTAVAIKNNWEKIKPLVYGAVSAFLVFKVVLPIIQAVRGAILTLNAAVGALNVGAVIATIALTGMAIAWSNYASKVEKANLDKVLQAASQANQQLASSTNKAGAATQDQADAMKQAGKEAGKNVQSFDEVHQLMEDTASAAEQAGAGLGDMAMPSLEAPGGAGAVAVPGLDMSALEQAVPTLSGFWDEIKTSAARTWEAVKADAVSIWTGIIQWFANAWEGMKANAVEAWNWLAGGLANIWDGIAATASTVWTGISTTVVGIWNWLAGLVGGIFGPIETFISTTWNNLLTMTTNVWNTIWTTLSTIWSNLRTAASTIWGDIWTFLSGLWNNIRQMAGTVWQAIADLITGKIDLRTAIKTIWDAIARFFSDTWNSLATMARNIWGSVARFFSDTWNNIKRAVEDIWGQIKTFFENTWENLKSTAFTVWETIKSYIVTPIQGAWTRVNEIVGQMKQGISEAWSAIKATISSWAGKIYDAIAQPFNDAKKYVAGIISDAYNWGKNLIQNLINGIKSMINKVKSAVSSVVDTVKGYLGFSSPTEEGPGRYADKWAPNFMRMYAEGLLNNAGMVRAAVATVAESLAGMATTPAPAFAGSSSATGAGRGYAPVTAPEIHLHIGTLVADDYGLKKLEQRLREIRIFEEQRLGNEGR